MGPKALTITLAILPLKLMQALTNDFKGSRARPTLSALEKPILSLSIISVPFSASVNWVHSKSSALQKNNPRQLGGLVWNAQVSANQNKPGKSEAYHP